MKFLVDAQLPPALARWLTAQGYEATHVTDLGLGAADDITIWQRAYAEGYALISKDDDFVLLRLREPEAKLIWVTMGNCSKANLLSRFATALPELLAALEGGEALVELR
jgi:predicted nuclease of predicted toxin-antitoxin system